MATTDSDLTSSTTTAESSASTSSDTNPNRAMEEVSSGNDATTASTAVPTHETNDLSENKNSSTKEGESSSSTSNSEPKDLREFLTHETTRVILKWEGASNTDGHSKLIVGANTYLPLGGRGHHALEIPTAGPQSPLPSNQGQLVVENNTQSARELLFGLVSKIFRLSPHIRELDLEGFGDPQCLEDDTPGTTTEKQQQQQQQKQQLDIEDVFDAFARDENSPWRRGILAVLRTWDCDMNSFRGNHLFVLEEHEYPTGLEELYIHNPKGGVLSSSIFKIASRSPKLKRYYVFDGSNDGYNHDERENIIHDHNHNLHRFNGSRLTESSIDAICEVLSFPNQLLEMNQLPFRELLQLPEADFCRCLEATTKARSRNDPQIPEKRVCKSAMKQTRLRFPLTLDGSQPKVISSYTILASRSEFLRFYLLWKRSLEVLRNPRERSLAPTVLELCQKQKSTKQWMPCNFIDLVFAMMQDSLEILIGDDSSESRNLLQSR